MKKSIINRGNEEEDIGNDERKTVISMKKIRSLNYLLKTLLPPFLNTSYLNWAMRIKGIGEDNIFAQNFKLL